MSLFHRALAGATATAMLSAALVAGAGPAGANGSEMCVYEGSTRLFTANDGDYKVWVDETVGSFRDTHICWAAPNVGSGEIVVRQPIAGTLVPTVTPDTTDEDCPRLFELQDPVQLMTRLGESLAGDPGYVCFGVADGAYRVTFTPPSPRVSTRYWLVFDKGTPLADLFCAVVIGNADCSDPTKDYVRLGI